MNKLDALTPVSLAPALRRTSTLTGAAVDLQAYDGPLKIVLDCAAGTGDHTLDVKIQDCATSGGSYADVTGLAFAQVTTTAKFLELNTHTRDLKRYIKVIGTIGGTSTPTFDYSVCAIAQKKYQP
jgi:hypothetical protein